MLALKSLGGWIEGGWGGGKALIFRTPPNSQSAPARAQVRHWRHEQLRLPDTSIDGQMLRKSRVRSDPAVHVALPLAAAAVALAAAALPLVATVDQ